MKKLPWIALLFVAAVALWLMLAGSGQLLGFDPGQIGTVLLVAATWISLWRISYQPRSALEDDISPGEWRAWIGFCFMLAAVAYFIGKLHLFRSDSVDARVVVRNLVTLGIAWAVLGQILASRWQGRVQADERDRDITRRAAQWGHGALVVVVIGLAVMLGFSPAPRLAWATPFFIANVLILMLMAGWLIEYGAMALQYWRDRR